MAETFTVWVRFENQTEIEDDKVIVAINGDVSDLRSAILAKFPSLKNDPENIRSLKLDSQDLANRKLLRDLDLSKTIVIYRRQKSEPPHKRIRKARLFSFETEGVALGSGPITKRTDTISRLLSLIHASDMMQEKSVVHISAPIFGGKTSFMFMLENYFLQKDSKVLSIRFTTFSRDRANIEKFIKESTEHEWKEILKSKELLYIILDDAQKTYTEKDFWSDIKQHESNPTSPVKIIVLATYTAAVADPHTPYTIKIRLYPDFLLATPNEMRELLDDYDSLCNEHNQPILGDYLRSVINRLSCGHLAYAKQILYQIFSARTEHNLYQDNDIIAELLSSSFFAYLSTMRCNISIHQLSKEQINVLETLISGNQIMYNEMDPITNSLIKAGFITEIQPTIIQFSSRLVRRLVLNKLCSSLQTADHMPKTVHELVKQSLPLFNRDLLLKTLSRGKDYKLREDAFQKEFYRIITSKLPNVCFISSEAGHTFATKPNDSYGAVDFYINGKYKWMIEFVAEGRNLKDHVSRFSNTGTYRHIPKNQWIVVDFRTKKVNKTTMKNHVLYVVYTNDCTEATLHYEDEKPITIQFATAKICRSVSDL